MVESSDSAQFSDRYEIELFASYNDLERAEIRALSETWDRATYPTVAASIVKHAQKHGFTGEYLRYLRKAANFNKKGARRKLLPENATRWNKGDEFLIERDGKIVTYGENV